MCEVNIEEKRSAVVRRKNEPDAGMSKNYIENSGLPSQVLPVCLHVMVTRVLAATRLIRLQKSDDQILHFDKLVWYIYDFTNIPPR